MNSMQIPIETPWVTIDAAQHQGQHIVELSEPAGAGAEFMPPEPAQLTLSETAQFLGMSEGAVKKLVKRKVLCAARDKSSNAWLIDSVCARSYRAQNPDKKTAEIAGGGASAVIDMEPTAQTSSNLVFQEVAQSIFNRGQVVPKNLQTLLENLNFANERLQGAMYRIGYLESQMEGLEDQLKVLPEYRARAAKGIIAERENAQLKDDLSKLNQQLQQSQSQMSDTCNKFEKLQSHWWWRIWCWSSRT